MTQVADLKVVIDDGVVKLIGRGELDVFNSVALDEAVRVLVAQAAGRVAVVDFYEVTYMDTHALWCIFRAAKALHQQGLGLTMVVAHHSVPERLIRLTGWDRIVRLVHSAEEIPVGPQ
ncbi:MAG: STAS domain-containing protein [Armatimonadota bacterium]